MRPEIRWMRRRQIPLQHNCTTRTGGCQASRAKECFIFSFFGRNRHGHGPNSNVSPRRTRRTHAGFDERRGAPAVAGARVPRVRHSTACSRPTPLSKTETAVDSRQNFFLRQDYGIDKMLKARQRRCPSRGRWKGICRRGQNISMIPSSRPVFNRRAIAPSDITKSRHASAAARPTSVSP